MSTWQICSGLPLISYGKYSVVAVYNGVVTGDSMQCSRPGVEFHSPHVRLHGVHVTFTFTFSLACREVYEICQPGFRGRCTAPLVVDRVARRLVSNESSDIVRNLNNVQLPSASDVDLVPPTLESEVDQLNDLVYNQVLVPFNHYCDKPIWSVKANLCSCSFACPLRECNACAMKDVSSKKDVCS